MVSSFWGNEEKGQEGSGTLPGFSFSSVSSFCCWSLAVHRKTPLRLIVMYYLLFTIKAPKSSHVMAVAGERCTSETYFKTCEGFGRLNGAAVCGVRPGESGVISRKGRVPPLAPCPPGSSGAGHHSISRENQCPAPTRF